jgi:hypothetical protein
VAFRLGQSLESVLKVVAGVFDYKAGNVPTRNRLSMAPIVRVEPGNWQHRNGAILR